MSNANIFSGGPAYLVWNSLTLKMLDDWKISDPDQFFDIKSATGVGQTKGIKDKMGKITFTPKIFASTLAAQLDALFPYTNNSNGGALLRPTTDLPAIVHMRNGGTSNLGLTATCYAAFVTKMPKLSFAPNKPLCGPVELTYLQALGTNVGDAASLVDTASATYAEPGWSLSDELYDRYTLAFGYVGDLSGSLTDGDPTLTVASTAGVLPGQGVTGPGVPDGTTVLAVASPTTFTLSANATSDESAQDFTFTQVVVITDKEGIEFTPDCKMEMQQPGQEPTRDAKQDLITGVLEFTPHNIDIDAWYAAFFPEVGQALGASYEQYGFAGSITGANAVGVTLGFPQLARFKSGTVFSRVKPRKDKVQLQCIDTYADGVWGNVFNLGAR